MTDVFISGMIQRIKQTVDAEITAMMPLQRARDAESRVRNKLSNGPRRVQSNVGIHRVFCNVGAYVSCRGYAGIPQKGMEIFHECKVAPRISFLFVLDRKDHSVGGVLFFAAAAV